MCQSSQDLPWGEVLMPCPMFLISHTRSTPLSAGLRSDWRYDKASLLVLMYILENSLVFLHQRTSLRPNESICIGVEVLD